jgi:hypothetical protein
MARERVESATGAFQASVDGLRRPRARGWNGVVHHLLLTYGSIEQAQTEFLLQCTDPATELQRLHAKRLRSGGLAAEVSDFGEEMQSVQTREGVRGV